MKISCQACGTKYSIPDEKVRGEGRTFKIRCKNCGEMMTVKGVADPAAAGSAAAAPAAAAPAEDQWYYAVGTDRKGQVSKADLT